VLCFDLVTPLQRGGAGAVRRRTEERFSTFDGPFGYTLPDLRTSAGADVAFSESTLRPSPRTRSSAGYSSP
jgi:hypothetical protein